LPLSDSEIEAWALLSDRQPTWWEHQILRQLDAAYLTVWSDHQADEQKRRDAQSKIGQRR